MMVLMSQVHEALATAFRLHQAGRLAEACEIYREILAAEPNHAGAWHCLGVLQRDLGHHELAIDYISRSLVLNAANPEAYNNLGFAFDAIDDEANAVKSYRK